MKERERKEIKKEKGSEAYVRRTMHTRHHEPRTTNHELRPCPLPAAHSLSNPAPRRVRRVASPPSPPSPLRPLLRPSSPPSSPLRHFAPFAPSALRPLRPLLRPLLRPFAAAGVSPRTQRVAVMMMRGRRSTYVGKGSRRELNRTEQNRTSPSVKVVLL